MLRARNSCQICEIIGDDLFRQPCSRRGLLADDAECRRCLRESFASDFVPYSYVIATVHAHCAPSDPLSHLNEHKSLFLSDIGLRHRGRAKVISNENTALLYVLVDVQERLQLIGKFTFDTFHLQTPQEDRSSPTVEEDEPKLDTDRLRGAVEDSIPKLNSERELHFMLLSAVFFQMSHQVTFALLF